MLFDCTQTTSHLLSPRRERDEKAAAEVAAAAAAEKKKKMKAMAALLGGELAKVDAEEKEKAEAAAKPADDREYRLYSTMYEYKSDDPEDLTFAAGEILR